MKKTMEENSICIICKIMATAEVSVTLECKGAETINYFSKEKKSDVVAFVGSRLHITCRRRFTDKRYIDVERKSSGSDNIFKRSTRTEHSHYDVTQDCLFCGTFVDFSKKTLSGNEAVTVKTDKFSETTKLHCLKRNDEWSFIVRGRIEYFLSDLHAADCVYHNSCASMIRMGKQIPQQYQKDKDFAKKKRLDIHKMIYSISLSYMYVAILKIMMKNSSLSLT